MKASTRWLMLSPALILVGGVGGGGLILILLQSLGWTPAGTTWSLAAYRTLLDPSSAFWPALRHSVTLALGATIISLILGLLIAWALVSRKESRWLSFAAHTPILVPHVVGALVILVLLAPTGLVSRVLLSWGFIESDQSFPILVQDPWGIGVIALYAWKEAPFVALVAAAALRNVDEGVIGQARNLGARGWSLFRHAYLPYAWPGLATAGLLVFAFVLGAYEGPLLLGALYPTSAPVLAVNRFTNPLDLATDWPQAMATGVVLAAVGLVVGAQYLRVVGALRGGRGA